MPRRWSRGRCVAAELAAEFPAEAFRSEEGAQGYPEPRGLRQRSVGDRDLGVVWLALGLGREQGSEDERFLGDLLPMAFDASVVSFSMDSEI